MAVNENAGRDNKETSLRNRSVQLPPCFFVGFPMAGDREWERDAQPNYRRIHKGENNALGRRGWTHILDVSRSVAHFPRIVHVSRAMR